ncbi:MULTISPECIES: FTR1 family protein [Nostoc]|uniref:FTR1 family iron permease n=1 Tax=Nostoc paludosum FACHB-159 TaxID=2692908 RepID=A0ABR8KCB7_9NOSO|nr:MULTISPECIES: FTR1 family protein [Nostoc]MBD2680101.1 FTR1 family iron permease [Nostoc sp. FACHB-857]MBD2736359.1 FTR1 family iron permease [Nostoc paludosum FACHB-159]
MNWSAALPTFFITLREGVEAALVVGIVFACLQQAQQQKLQRWVYLGVFIGILASFVFGLLIHVGLQGLQTSKQLYAPVFKQLFEVGLGVIAIAMLSWMLIWMTRQARFLKAEIEGSVKSALGGTDSAGWAIFSLIFIAVFREGLETALFIVAKFQEGLTPVLGAIGGLAIAVVIGMLLFKWSIRINLSRFFQVMGVLLLLIVSGLVISVLRHVDAAAIAFSQINPEVLGICGQGNTSCLLGPQVWDFSTILPDRQFPGILLKTLFGYTQKLYLVQAVGYLLFWITIGGLYFRSLSQPTQLKPAAKSS